VIAYYLAQLQALLPRGMAWSRAPDSVLTKLLRGFAAVFASVHTAVEALLVEIDPRTTSLLLYDYERVAGLPDDCITALEIDQSLAARRLALHAKWTAVGGATPSFFIDMAARLGYEDATVSHRFTPATCNDDCNAALHGQADRFVWVLNLPSDGDYLVATCNSACDDPLASWGDKALECRVSAVSPAHTTVLFAYSEG
jgi:uncharacterized protein YmfQ (DUF2313 family)